MAQGEKNATRARLLRFTIAIAALMCAFAVTVYKSQGRWQFSWNPKSLLAQPEVAEGEYDLSSIVVLNRVLLQLQENYVDEERFDPRWMLSAGLNEIQKSEPEIVATFDKPLSESPTEVLLQVGSAQQRFTYGDIESLWEMSLKFKEMFRFIQDNMGASVDPHEVEYAAINGVLRTLDPHSVLLSPEVYRDMLEGNRGNFGGLGIVIRMIEGELTVQKPMGADTPAGAAGILKGDKIVQIGDQSTLNMEVSEAVELLRGEPDTSVDLHILRDGWDAPQVFTLERAEIKIPSVESARLDNNIGYIKLKGFQGNTHKDMVAHLEQLEADMGSIEGLVLDLRGNPGGLLEQAIEISDEFLDDGTIVTTVGSGRRYRKPYPAHADGTQPTYPIVVLIDPSSASASEIVAGALKNHDRALIVGETSFGKGSVQVLYELQDGSALKLTIAQYLTPGDVSIQSVGIVPDVKLVPMTVKRDELDLYLERWVRREANLKSHLDNEKVRLGEKPLTTLKYVAHADPLEELAAVAPAEPVIPDEAVTTAPGDDEPTPLASQQPLDDEGADPDQDDAAAPEDGADEPEDGEEEVAEDDDDGELAPGDDPQVKVAMELLRAAGDTWKRDELVASLQPTLDSLTQREDTRLTSHLQHLGVDWTDGAMPDSPALEVELSTDRPDARFAAGDEVELTVTVTNTGSAPVYRIYGITMASTRRFEDREFLFGRIEPGQSVTRTETITISESQASRNDVVDMKLFSDARDGGSEETELASAALEMTTEGAPTPHFAFAYTVLDADTGDGDGLAEVGETVTLRLLVENTGKGTAARPVAYIRNLNGGSVFLEHGREQADALAPGARRTFDFTFNVKGNPEDDDDTALDFDVHVYDRDLGRALVETVEVPVDRDASVAASKAVATKQVATFDGPRALRIAPDDDAAHVASGDAGVRLQVLRTTDTWLQVGLGDVVGWVPADQVEVDEGELASIGTGVTAPTDDQSALALTFAGFAPRVELSTSAGITSADTVTLEGAAFDDGELRDVYVFVYSETDHVFETRKVAYQQLGSQSGQFEIEVPLNEGMNRIKVVARDDDDLEVADSVYVYRR